MARRCKPNSGLNTLGAERIFYRAIGQQLVGGSPMNWLLGIDCMLPHIGSATGQTRDAMGFRALDNLDAFFAGKAPGDQL
jgi:hypothetical protein